MEEAATHAVDNLANTPELLFTLAILIILTGTIIKVIPMYRDLKKEQIANDAKFKKAQIDIERDRELRKMNESKIRRERERENAVIMSRSVDAQERSTAAINAMTAQMAVFEAQLEASRVGSQSMHDKVEDMSVEVHDIHRSVVRDRF